MSEEIKWADLTLVQRDRLVDEKVIKRDDSPGEQTIAWTGRDMLFEIAKQLIETDTTTIIPSYTTSMDAAWLVVTKMIGTGKLMERYPESYYLFLDKLMFLCSDYFHFVDLEPRWFYNVNPERICIAALQAYGFVVIV